MEEQKSNFLVKIKNIFIGKSLDLKNKDLFKSITLIAFFAWVGLGSDGLSSSCYGPEEAFVALGTHPNLAILIAILSTLTIYIISASYNQIIHLFPAGGGGYLVASKLLSPTIGMVSGCALLIDYVLTITISVASGSDALFSLFPASFHAFKLSFTILCILTLTLLNLRGVRESIFSLVPIFVLFILTHLVAIVYAIVSHLDKVEPVSGAVLYDINSSYSELGLIGFGFLLLKAFSMGAGTFTGIEAVSNGIPMLSEPRVKTARKTMAYMTFSLSFTVMGLMIAYLLFNVHHEEGKTLNAVLFENMTEDWGLFGKGFVWVILLAEACLLFVAAQTGFLDGPRILANMAVDKWFPYRFAMLSDRLVIKNGVLIMAIASLAMILISHGSVRFLVVLYSINVFITFVLSQLGMVRHWWLSRDSESKWKSRLLINGTGLITCLLILATVIIVKFDQGGWITLIITGLIVLFSLYVRKHYNRTEQLLQKLNAHANNADQEVKEALSKVFFQPSQPAEVNKTAVILVSDYDGEGVLSLLQTISLFEGTFVNYVFVEIGLLNVRTFVRQQELEALEKDVSDDLDKYVHLVERHGFKGESIKLLGTNLIEEMMKEASGIIAKYPNCVFFAGQLVFPKETFMTHYLHNYEAFTLQKRFYKEGIPFVIVPVVLK
jgi:amino acid transporter